MKIVRFRAAGKTRYGVLEGSHVVEYAGTPFVRGEVRIDGIGALKNSVVKIP